MGYHSFNGKGAKPLLVEFFCQTSHSDVLQAKPHFVADVVSWGFAPMNIVKLGHVVSCLDQCCPCLTGCPGHPGREVIQGFKPGLTNGFKSTAQILAGIEHEWGGLSSVVIGKFGNQNPVVPVMLSLVHIAQRGGGTTRPLG